VKDLLQPLASHAKGLVGLCDVLLVNHDRGKEWKVAR
jgi:hypothetical protein